MKNLHISLKSGATALLIGAAFCFTPDSYALIGGFPAPPEAPAPTDSASLYPDEALRRDLIHQTKVIYLNGDSKPAPGRDSIESLISYFYADQFRHAQDPEAPYFMFMSKDAKLAMGIGGSVKVEGWFDWNGTIDGGKFDVYDINMEKTPENWRNLGATVSGTGLFFTLLGRNTAIGDFSAYIQAGFDGYGGRDFKLKKAWFKWRDFTVGKAPTTFSDPAAQPDLLDGAGSNGKLDRSNVLVRYLHTFKGKWSVAASVEFPSSSPDVDDQLVKKCNDYIPDIAALGQFQWNRGLSHVRLAAMMRTMSYHDLVSNKTHHQTGWGVLLAATVRAGHYVQFFGETSIGKGIASYTGDLSNGNYDLLADAVNPGRLYAPTTLGATFGVKAFWMPKLTSTFAVGSLRNFAKSSTHDDTYKYGQYLAVNLVYKIMSRMQVGLEYLAGKRMNFNGDHSNANRLQALFTVSF